MSTASRQYLPLPQPPLAARNSEQSVLRDTLSPGRVLNFDFGMIPGPSRTQPQPATNAVGLYCVAKYDVRQGFPEGSALGYSVDARSPFAWTADTSDPTTFERMTAARYADVFGEAASGGIEDRLVPSATQFAHGCALIIASGQQYANHAERAWVYDSNERHSLLRAWPNGANAEAGTGTRDSLLNHRAAVRFPQGDMGQGSGAAFQTLIQTSREQPFGVRIVPGQPLVVLLAVAPRYLREAWQVATDEAATAFFPFHVQGSLFFSPLQDDRVHIR